MSSSKVATEYDMATKKSKRLDRSKSRVLPLREYHNKILNYLISYFSEQTVDNVIDFGAGKGGSMFKYLYNKFKYMTLIDISKNSIKEAKNRYINNSKLQDINATFLVGDISSIYLQQKIKQEIYDIAVCNFVIHYLFSDKNTINNFVKNVYYSLKKGGLIIITTTDHETITDKEFRKTKYSEINFISNKESDYGEKYKFKLEDAVYDQAEYVVYRDVINDVFIDNGFELLEDHNLVFDNNLFKNELFNDIYRTMDDDMRDISGMYKYYVYRKM